MRDLKELLDRELGTVLPAADARAAIDRRVARRRRRRNILLPATTLILTAGLVAGLTYAFSPTSQDPPANLHAIAMPGVPLEAIADGDLLWVTTSERGCEGPICDGFVVKLDTIRGEVVDRVPVTTPNGIAAGAGSIWVVSFADDTLLRLEPATGSIQATIPLVLPFTVGDDGDRSFLPVDVDANDEAVWVSSGRGALVHIDPATNEVVDVVARRSHSGGPVAIGQEGIWVADSLNGAVLVDPATHRVVDAVTLNDEIGQRFSANTLLTRDGSVWSVGNWAHPVEELDGASYVAGDGHAVVEIDERSHEVKSILEIRDGAAWLVAGGDVWVAEGDGAYLRLIDRAGRRLGPSLKVPFGRPLAISGLTGWSAVGSGVRSWPVESAEGPPARAVTIDIRRSSDRSGDPEAIARFDPQEQWMCPDGWSLVNADGTEENVTFDCGQTDVFQAPTGSVIAVMGDFASLEAKARLPGDPTRLEPNVVPDVDPGSVVTFTYEVSWPDGSLASFWLHLTVTGKNV